MNLPLIKFSKNNYYLTNHYHNQNHVKILEGTRASREPAGGVRSEHCRNFKGSLTKWPWTFFNLLRAFSGSSEASFLKFWNRNNIHVCQPGYCLPDRVFGPVLAGKIQISYLRRSQRDFEFKWIYFVFSEKYFWKKATEWMFKWCMKCYEDWSQVNSEK